MIEAMLLRINKGSKDDQDQTRIQRIQAKYLIMALKVT